MPDVHAHAGILGALIPDARREVMAGAGHLAFAEQPVPFTERVRTFLASVRGD